VRDSAHELEAAPRGQAAADAALSRSLFFAAAGISLAASVYLFFTGQREEGIFVGLWVPSILSAGALVLQGRGHE
jgi:hypothetical protein